MRHENIDYVGYW